MSECGAAQSVRRVRCCGKATHRLGALDNVQLLHDVVECGPLCRLRLQAAAHEAHYVLELLLRGVGCICIGRQHVAFFRQLQLLLARNVILHHLGDADVLKALIGNAARQYLVHDHPETVNFRSFRWLGWLHAHKLRRFPRDA